MTMDVSYIARNISLSESFRDHVVERTERLQRLAEGADTLEVRVTKESHHKHSDEAVRVELTVRGPRDVVRAEAAADDDSGVVEDPVGQDRPHPGEHVVRRGTVKRPQGSLATPGISGHRTRRPCGRDRRACRRGS